MTEQTQTIQEPQKPLSLVEHLRTTLYNLKAQHSRIQGAIEGYRSAVTPDDDYRDLLITCERTAEQLEQQITAQEQTIAILETLLSERWYGAERWRPTSCINGVWSEGKTHFLVHLLPGGPDDHYCEPDLFAALLKAHAALKPQEGATSGKEPTDV